IWRMIRQSPMKSVDVRDGLIVEGDDDVTISKAGSVRRTVLFDADDKHAARDRQLMAANQHAMHRRVLAGYSNVASPDFAVFDKPSCDELSRIDRDRKTDSLRGKNDRRIDANHVAVRCYQRTTGVAWIESRVRLDHVID